MDHIVRMGPVRLPIQIIIIGIKKGEEAEDKENKNKDMEEEVEEKK